MNLMEIEIRKIKFFLALHVEVRVSVSDEMVEGYRECKRMAGSGECKDCDSCSLLEVEFPCTGMCELDTMRQLLEENDGTINTER